VVAVVARRGNPACWVYPRMRWRSPIEADTYEHALFTTDTDPTPVFAGLAGAKKARVGMREPSQGPVRTTRGPRYAAQSRQIGRPARSPA